MCVHGMPMLAMTEQTLYLLASRCSAQNAQDHCAHKPNDNGLLGATVAAELNKSKIEHWHVMVRKPVAYRTNTYTENHECLKKAVPHYAQSFVYPFWSVSLTLILQIGIPEGSAYTNSVKCDHWVFWFVSFQRYTASPGPSI